MAADLPIKAGCFAKKENNVGNIESSRSGLVYKWIATGENLKVVWTEFSILS
jgi:hypothetical protein